MCDDDLPTQPFPSALTGDRVCLRLLTEDDLEHLAKIVREPEVSAWWPRQDAERLRRDMLETDDTASYAVELSSELIGAIMCSEETDPDYRSASIDLFLDSRHLSQGLGSDALRTLATWLFRERGHHRLTIDPAVANDRARRAYEKVGFKPVGVMRAYERGPDCTWRDALLMDMLADELR